MVNYLSPVKMSITIGGKSMPTSDMKLVQNIEIKYEGTGASNCTITMYDPDLKILNTGGMYKEKVPISVKVTWQNKTTSFKGYLVDISASISEVHTLKLNCMDESYKLDRKIVKKNWGKKKRSDIARAIFSKYGLKAVVDTSVDKPAEEGKEENANQDVTQSEMRREHISQKAREVIQKNVFTVQQIAKALGEHMAETEILLREVASGYQKTGSGPSNGDSSNGL